MFLARVCMSGSKATSWLGEFIHANEGWTLTSSPSAYGPLLVFTWDQRVDHWTECWGAFSPWDPEPTPNTTKGKIQKKGTGANGANLREFIPKWNEMGNALVTYVYVKARTGSQESRKDMFTLNFFGHSANLWHDLSVKYVTASTETRANVSSKSPCTEEQCNQTRFRKMC